MSGKIEWEYKSYECKVWFTSRADVKWSAVSDSDLQTGLILTSDQDEDEVKLESGKDKLEEMIDDEFSHRNNKKKAWKS